MDDSPTVLTGKNSTFIGIFVVVFLALLMLFLIWVAIALTDYYDRKS